MPPNMANNTRGQRSRAFTRTPRQTRPFGRGSSQSRPFGRGSSPSRPFSRGSSRSRPFSRGSSQTRPFSRGSSRSRPFSRGFNQSRPFSRGSSQSRGFNQSRPFSRGSHQTRPYNNRNSYNNNENSWNQPQNESSFRGQSFNGRSARGSFRSSRGACSTFPTARGARASVQRTRGARSSSNTGRYTEQYPNPSDSQTNFANAQQRTQGVKRKMSTSLGRPPSKLSKNDSLEKKRRTIFVGNVPLRTTKLELKKLFEKYGFIESVRFRAVPRADIRQLKKVALIKKHFHPKRTSMNAYVVFYTQEDAERAQEMNGQKFKEHCLRVTLSTVTRPLTDKQSIFVGNLPFDIEDDDLIEIFKDCGDIESVRVSREADSAVGRGFGYVNFASLDGVELALQMENVQFNDRVLRIKRCETKVDLFEGSDDWISVKIDNLPLMTTRSFLTKVFKGCGEIINVTFNVKSTSKKSAIVAFATAEAANKALDVKLVIKNRAVPIVKDPFNPHKHIFIRNVPLNAKNAHVREVLDQCGNINACKLLLTPLPPYTAGFGIVEFEEIEGAQNALQLGTFKIMQNDVNIESYIKEKPKTESESEDDTDDDDDINNEEQQNGEKNATNAEDDEESDSEELEQDDDDQLQQDDIKSEDDDEENEELAQNAEQQEDEDSDQSDEDSDINFDSDEEMNDENAEEELDEDLEEEEEIDFEDDDDDDD